MNIRSIVDKLNILKRKTKHFSNDGKTLSIDDLTVSNTLQVDVNLNVDSVATFGTDIVVGNAIGIGTTSPNQELHIESSTAGVIQLTRKDTSIASGNDIGAIHFGGTTDNGTTYHYNSAVILCEAQGAWDTTDTDSGSRLIFKVTPDGSNTNSEVMRITHNGYLMIGSTAGTSQLNIKGSSATHGSNGIVTIRNTDTSMDAGDVTLRIRHDDTSTANGEYWIGFYEESTLRGGIDAEVVYDTFTAAHPTDMDADQVTSVRPGMILCSTGEVFYRQSGVSNAWVRTRISTVVKDKAAVGVYTRPDARGSTARRQSEETGEMEEHIIPSPTGQQLYKYNAIGEGQILVTDSGGNIEAGDYICSSNRMGHGMLQDDDILHNYTVAKATETIDFSSIDIDSEYGFKSVLIACTYHAG